MRALLVSIGGTVVRVPQNVLAFNVVFLLLEEFLMWFWFESDDPNLV